MYLSGAYSILPTDLSSEKSIPFSELIPAAQLRRMSTVMKIGIYAALKAHQLAGKPNLDAIITATAKGCVSDTAKFLISYHEEATSPTAFIQSTHNAIAGQIALLLQSNAYNFTYTQADKSFEAAFLDAQMHMAEGANHVLCGWFDEGEQEGMASASFFIFSKDKINDSAIYIDHIEQLPF